MNKQGQEPTTLYHYTTVEACMEIIRTKSLWLSSSYFMHKSNEYMWIKVLFDSVINDLKTKLPQEYLKSLKSFSAFLNKHAHLVNGHEVDKYPETFPYFASFSAEKDQESQWDSHADVSHGVAIGFNCSDLQSRFGSSSDETAVVSDKLCISKAIYDYAEQEAIVKKLATSFQEQIETEFDNFYFDILYKYETSHFEKEYLQNEQEYRLIFSPMISSRILERIPHSFRAERDKIIPYYILPLDKDIRTGDQVPVPITEIVLGPKCNIHRDILLDFCNYEGIDVSVTYAKCRK